MRDTTREMTARLRLVPIYGAESGRHYLILDRMGGITQEQAGVITDQLREAAPEAIPLVFPWPVYVPQEDGEEVPAEAPVQHFTMSVPAEMPLGDLGHQVQRALAEHGRVLARRV